MSKKRLGSLLLLTAVVMFGLGFVTGILFTVTDKTVTSTQSYVASEQPTYVISTDGTTIRALSTATGKVEFSGTDAATIIMDAAVPNSKVLIKAGTYIVNKEITIENSNVELYGEGQTVSILKEAAGADCDIIGMSQVSNIYIHDLQLDGNRLNEAFSNSSEGNGIIAWRVTALTIANNYVHDNRNFGINISECTNTQVLNNLIVNSDANGITVDNQGGGSRGGIVARGNTVNGASDVGITSWYGYDFLAQNNTIENVMMNTSPYAANSHVGMYVEQGGSKITYRGNQIENVGTALEATGGTAILFDANTAHNCLIAFYADHVNGLTLTNSTFDGIPTAPKADLPYYALDLDPEITSAIVTGNQFIKFNVTSGIVIALNPPNGTFSDNTIDTANGTYQAIYIRTPSGWTLQNNTIITTTSTTAPTSTTTALSHPSLHPRDELPLAVTPDSNGWYVSLTSLPRNLSKCFLKSTGLEGS